MSISGTWLDFDDFEFEMHGNLLRLTWGEACERIRNRYSRDLGEAKTEEFIQRVFAKLTAPQRIRAAVDSARTADPRDWYLWYTGPNEKSLRWNYLKSWLTSAGWNSDSISQLDLYSTEIVKRLPPPALIRSDGFCGRGNVMGYVQSGKTTSFMAVIAKAVDAGYDGVIVLSGITNNLRDQTFDAMDKALGIIAPDPAHVGSTGGQSLWQSITEYSPSSDKLIRIAPWSVLGGGPFIGVFKKNVSRLKALDKWFQLASAGRGGVGAVNLADKSVLIIDDEADQASINSVRKASEIDNSISPNCSVPDEISRTAINQAIVNLCKTLPKEAFVGYSATPFANLLSDPNDHLGVYPRDFIVALPNGDGYFGPKELFGRDPIDEDDVGLEGLDVIRGVTEQDQSELGSLVKSRPPVTPMVPLGLRNSIYWFLIATYLRECRETTGPFWSSMLVNLSAMTKSHFDTQTIISRFLDSLSGSESESFWEEFRNLAKAELQFDHIGVTTPDGKNIEQVEIGARSVLSRLRIIVDNFRSPDRLNYESDEPGPIMVIGGNTLSRGLVLRGLVSTFFLRTSRGYDVLLQMGRWFGYRKGYEDLQRIWMRPEMEDSFRFLALIEEEIRGQIETLANEATPLDIGVLIRTHPKLSVTSRVPMQVREIGYGGSRVDTTLFPRTNREWLESNLSAATNFLREISDKHEMKSQFNSPIFKDVSSDDLLGFLSAYQFHDDARIAEREAITKYIQHCNRELEELRDWDVFVFNFASSRNSGEKVELAPGVFASRISRAMRQPAEVVQTADIKTLSSPADWRFGVEDSKLSEFLGANSELARTQAFWHDARATDHSLKAKGMLGLYLVDKDSVPSSANSKRHALEAEHDFLGLSFFFPLSKDPRRSATYVGPPAYERAFEEDDFDSDPNDDRDFESDASGTPDELDEGYFEDDR